MAYATYSDVQARIPSPTFTSTTQTRVTQWLVEADALINGALLEAGLTSPNANANGLEILKSVASDYAEGHARMGLAAAGGDGSNDDGLQCLTRFDKWISEIAAGRHNAMLQGAAGDGARRVRYPSNLDDAGNAIEPIFTKDETVSDLGNQF